MIAITFALPTESSELIRRLSDVHRGEAWSSGKIDHQTVAILHTGVGAKNCRARMETLLHKARPKMVISSGFAGAVREGFEVGDLIFAENFSDRQLLTKAKTMLSERNPQSVKLFTCTTIIHSIAERTEIARANDAAAVDMETEMIATLCNSHAVPLLSLRAISDTPRQPFPAPPSMLFDVERQRTNVSRLAAYSITHPLTIWRLFHFSSQVRRAREAMTRALVELVHGL